MQQVIAPVALAIKLLTVPTPKAEKSEHCQVLAMNKRFNKKPPQTVN